MNANNVRTAIAIMQRAAQFDCIDMAHFQGERRGAALHVATTEAELHTCGNKACFAGYVAVSREWRAAGGSMASTGEPIIELAGRYAMGEGALSYWLGVSEGTAEGMVFGDTEYYGNEKVPGMPAHLRSLFYRKAWSDVTAEDVIAKLELILSGELV